MKTESEKVFQVSNFFIKKAKEEGKEITNKKLQKLLYYAQAWSVTLRDDKLFDEDIEAWVHGPAVKKVYLKYADYGRDNLATLIKDRDLVVKALKPDEVDFLNAVWNRYGNYTGNDLEMLTHSEKPWQDARKNLEPYEASHVVISTDSMKAFYGKEE